jgi:hypothetical protein
MSWRGSGTARRLPPWQTPGRRPERRIDRNARGDPHASACFRRGTRPVLPPAGVDLSDRITPPRAGVAEVGGGGAEPRSDDSAWTLVPMLPVRRLSCAVPRDATRTRRRAAVHRADLRDGTAGVAGRPGGKRRGRSDRRAQASRGSTLRWGRAQPDPLATQGCTYPRPSAAGQTGTSYNFGRPRGGGWIDIRLSPSRHGLAKVRIVRLGSLDAFVGRDGSSPSSPRLVKEPVAARQNLPLISSLDFLTQEIRGNRGHTQARPDRQINGGFFNWTLTVQTQVLVRT